MLHRVGIVLAGCGTYDGSDVHEAVFAATALARAGARLAWLAPEGPQADVVDHATAGTLEQAPPRDIAQESARIARGGVDPLTPEAVGGLSGLVVPGGYGTLKNLFQDLLVPGRPARLKDSVRGAFGSAVGRVPVAAIGLAHRLLEELFGDLAFDPLALPPGEAIVRPDRLFAYAPGFLGARSLPEAAAGIDRMVAGLVPLLRPVPPR
ncbi:MAG: hypothetical protein KBD01_15595 [Acidobacteria bacterium]|nr:hypothetical protein [Acidobacteriota bacterium]